ncbi:MAG: DUF2852 domain-containing protein [Siculibacillus sp.]|nr:DUF2852 domain-containing protein [Siculibacillus sp.]
MNPEFGPRTSEPFPGSDGADLHPRRCCGRAPWPVAAAAVGGAFWLFPPLGVAGLAYLAMRGRHGHHHGRGPGRGECASPWGNFGDRGFGGRGFGGRGRRGSGNVAFDEARAEAWRQLEEEAQAFDDFRRRERTARDREVYDRFRGERAAPMKPDAGDAGL